MLNFRRLKQDFSPNILKEGRHLHEKGGVISTKILSFETKSLRIGANVEGSYDNTHSCEIEVDRSESEVIDSNCDCSYQFDCQHLAAIFFHLESCLEQLIVEFAHVTDAGDHELEKTIEQVKKKQSKRQGVTAKKELVAEYLRAAEVLGKSAFFCPQESIEVDEAELAVILSPESLDERQAVKIQLALRLPLRSKPLQVQNILEFVHAVRHEESIWMSGRRYVFTLDSFPGAGRAILEKIIEGVNLVEKEEVNPRVATIDAYPFGVILAKAYELAREATGTSDTQFLPALYSGSLETPLKFAKTYAKLHVTLEYLEVPAPKLFLSPELNLGNEIIPMEKVWIFETFCPGLLWENTYYPFQEEIKRLHLSSLYRVREMIIPEPLFGSFVENALPELSRYAEVSNLQVLEKFITFPCVADLKARCQIDYLDGELDCSLVFLYGEHEIPAAARLLTYEQATSSITEDGIVARNLAEEQKLIQKIFSGFLFSKQEGVWSAKSEKKVVEFMTEIVPQHQETVEFICPQNLLDQFLFDDTKFQLHFKESDHINQYLVEVVVEGPLEGIEIDRLWECISSKKTFIELKKKVRASKTGKKGSTVTRPSKILVLNLETLTVIVQLFDEMGISTLKSQEIACPLWSLCGLHLSQLEGVPLTTSISSRLGEIRDQMLGVKPLPQAIVPDSIKAELRGYQTEGVAWLQRLCAMHLNGILADDMGLGKTLQSIIALTHYRKAEPTGQSLVVCPTSLLYNWKEEFTKFEPTTKVLVVEGTPGRRKKLLATSASYHVVVTSYTLLQKDLEQYRKHQFGYMILDEAHHIKNRGTRNAKSVKMVQAVHKLVLTGTPVENSLDELWSLFDFLMPGLLSSYERFVEKYIRNSGHAQSDSLEVLKRKVSPFILRRMKEDVLQDLPPVSEIIYHCHLSEVQKELYHSYASSAKKELLKLVEKEGFNKVRIHVLATLTRLKQICCHPAIFAKDEAQEGDSAKYEMFLELLQGLIDGGHKTVVFSQYTRMLSIMRDDMERLGIRYCYLDGSSKNRMDIVHEFNETPSIPVFLVSLKAGGTGLNLVGADSVIHFDMWWNPAVEDQATDRVHRLGQERPVSAYKLVVLDSIEEKILQKQRSKRGLVKKVISCDDEALSKLTWEEVLDLLQV